MEIRVKLFFRHVKVRTDEKTIVRRTQERDALPS